MRELTAELLMLQIEDNSFTGHLNQSLLFSGSNKTKKY
jgi:hypothetical protein